jgi:hypothetical protein
MIGLLSRNEPVCATGREIHGGISCRAMAPWGSTKHRAVRHIDPLRLLTRDGLA